MKSQLIATAITLAIALTTTSSLAATPAAAAPSSANSNAGTAAGSNQGMDVGSNAGTHVGSNAGMDVGSNAGTHVGSNAPAAANTNQPSPANQPGRTTDRGPGLQNRPGYVGGDTGVYVTGATVNSNTNGDTTGNATPAAPNGTPQNATGTVPQSQGPAIGHQTTANVPPAADYNNASPQMTLISARPIQFEGQLVDLYSATATKPAPAQATTPAPAANSTAAHPAAAQTAVATPAPAAGLTENVGSVSKISNNSFGTPNHPGAMTPAPVSAQTISTSKPEVSVIVPSGNAAPASPALDKASIAKELNSGMPAAILVHHRLYTLVCSAKQLAPYAGQTLRITGRITDSGALIPDRIEAQSAGKYRPIALNAPDLNTTATAADR